MVENGKTTPLKSSLADVMDEVVDLPEDELDATGGGGLDAVRTTSPPLPPKF